MTFCTLIAVSSFFPAKASGGPRVSLKNLLDWKAVSSPVILTYNYDHGQNRRNLFYPARFYVVKKVGNSAVVYANSLLIFIFLYLSIIFCNSKRDFRRIYINSLFDPATSIPLLFLNQALAWVKPNLTTVLAPRGELLRLRLNLGSQIKRFKKYFYLQAFNAILAPAVDIYHFTSMQEVNDSLQVVPKAKNNYVMLPNLPIYSHQASPPDSLTPSLTGSDFIFSTSSRVAPEKNIHLSIKILKILAASNTSQSFLFNIVGDTSNASYYQHCLELLSTAPPNLNIRFLGPLDHRSSIACISTSHYSLYLTRGENYGHSIVESLMLGTPCLISRYTPWSSLSSVDSRLIQDIDAPDKICSQIDSLLSISPADYSKLRENILLYFHQNCIPRQQLLKSYSLLLG